MTEMTGEVLAQVRGQVGCITLNRPRALNALSLGMIRDITAALIAWRDDTHVLAVVVRGMGKEGPFGAFCAGGDIRFFHQAALAGNPELEDFFTEEYALNHLVHTYPKPYIALMDGIVMGGGMGISQGASLRIVTERSKLAMPETGIGLFPDVGGGYFLSRCPGRLGEYLGLTGHVLGGTEAMSMGLADALMAKTHAKNRNARAEALDQDVLALILFARLVEIGIEEASGNIDHAAHRAADRGAVDVNIEHRHEDRNPRDRPGRQTRRAGAVIEMHTTMPKPIGPQRIEAVLRFG